MNQDDDLIVKPTTRITPDSNVSLIDTSMGDERSYLDNYASYDSYIYGDADATVPFEGSGQRTHAAIPGSELVLLEDAPHGCNVSHAEAFNRALLAFLGRTG